MSIINFDKNKSNNHHAPSEQQGQVILADILEIECSHVNPRKTQGKDYEKTKESIKNVGILQIFAVTKMPNQDNYVIATGGNTRLTALKELYQEYLDTGDVDAANKIRHQQCVFVSYTDDLEMLVKHMAENEERSEMTLIDKARAVFKIREMYLQQNNIEDISSRKLVEFIHQQGWRRVNQPILTELSFAYEKLESAIPLALNKGLGKSKVNQLRIWLRDIRIFVDWFQEKHSCDFTSDDAERLYFNSLSEVDDDLEPIDFNDFYENYIYKLSEKLRYYDITMSSSHLSFELSQVLLNGKVLETMPQEEMSKKLIETTPLKALAEFPTPRKSRTPKDTDLVNNDNVTAEQTNKQTVAETISTSADTEAETQNSIADIPTFIDDEGHLQINSEELNKDNRKKCIEILGFLIENHDSCSKINRLVEFGKDNNLLQDLPPYFSLNLNSNDDLVLLHEIIDSGEIDEQYAVLQLLAITYHYFTNSIDISDLTDDERKKYELLCTAWNQHSSKYNKYHLLCETGVIHINRPHGTSAIIEVHRYFKKYYRFIYKTELFINSKEGGENGV